ncbi:MAG: M14 family zinc carboxypeptidase [Bacteroidota bacterium]
MQLKKTIAWSLWVLLLSACDLEIESPTVLKDFKTPASSAEVIRFSNRAVSHSNVLTLEPIGTSETGIPLVAVKAASNISQDTEQKLKVLIFAQQHGNEQSGKEAALLLISDLAKGKHEHWLENMEIWIVPQLNPDGSDVNQRRNAGGIDLNRDHIVQLAPETRAIQELFRREMHHVTVDIHEYQPFRESWEEFGAYKTFDVQVGVPTNPNVSTSIRDFALDTALAAIESHLNQQGFSFHNYLVGPVPTEGRTRHSTVDFDDGRQSFAIRNTLSFIYEGINGPDGFAENLERRTWGQYEALQALLELLHTRAPETIALVETERDELRHAQPGEPVAIRMEHFPGEQPLLLSLTSSRTGNDTLVVVEEYHPVVKPLVFAQRPKAYLVPKNDTTLLNFLELHQVEYREDFPQKQLRFISYKIDSISNSVDEELTNRYPVVSKQEREFENPAAEYFYVPTAQLHANFLVSLFEPQSMLGLAQRPGYEYLLQEGADFPILRAETD